MSLLFVLRNNVVAFGYQKCVLPSTVVTSKKRYHAVSGGQHARKVVRKSVRWISGKPGVVKSPLGGVKVPMESLSHYVWKNWEKFEDDPAATCGSTGRSYNYGMMRMLVTKCAQALLGHCGMKPGEVVGLMLPNIPEFIITIHGAMEAGLTVTFVNPLYTADEIKRQFENAGTKMIVTVPQLLDIALEVAPQLSEYRTTICIGGDDDEDKNIHGLQSLLMGGHEAELPGIDPNMVALLPYSSGTTGLPKGVELTHYNLIANLEQGKHPSINDLQDNQKEVVLSVLPFFHIYGFNGIMNTCMHHGLHLVTIPRFTPEDYIKCLIEYQPTVLFVVPSLLLFLASHPLVTKEHLASVRMVTSGAAPATEGLIQKFREKVDRDDISVRQGYGMTESSPVTLMMPTMTPTSKVGTCGVLYPGTEGKIISLTTQEILGPHKPGELLVRGPQVMKGYLNNEVATLETLDEEGWLHTGDVAYYDNDYYFFIIDRCKELIKVKGNQVSPTELENIILEVDGVADVAVVGIPDVLAGEIPRAYIVKKRGSLITEETIVNHLNPKVAPYKKLNGGVRFIEAIPRNPSGKVLRHELKVLGEKPAK